MAATPPRILTPDDRENDTAPRAEPAPRPSIEYFLHPVGEAGRMALTAWHDERCRAMQISKLEVIDVGGVPHLYTYACSVEFISAQWAVGIAIELGNAKAAQAAQRQVQQMVQTAPAGLAMPPPGDHRARGPRR